MENTNKDIYRTIRNELLDYLDAKAKWGTNEGEELETSGAFIRATQKHNWNPIMFMGFALGPIGMEVARELERDVDEENEMDVYNFPYDFTMVSVFTPHYITDIPGAPPKLVELKMPVYACNKIALEYRRY